MLQMSNGIAATGMAVPHANSHTSTGCTPVYFPVVDGMFALCIQPGGYRLSSFSKKAVQRCLMICNRRLNLLPQDLEMQGFLQLATESATGCHARFHLLTSRKYRVQA